MPAELLWDELAHWWHCTPQQAREQSEADILRARLSMNVRAQMAQQQAYFASPPGAERAG